MGWLLPVARGENILLDVADRMQNGWKSPDLHFRFPLTRWRSRRPDGAAGVERVKSAYRSSSNRPETISERGYTLNIFKVSMYSNPTAPLVRHRDGFSG